MVENKYSALTVDRGKFPPNKKDGESHKRPEKVAQATITKPSTANRIISAIFSENIDSLKEKLVYDVILPMARDFIAGGLKNAIDMAFYGKAGRIGYTDYSRAGSTQRVSYSSRSHASILENDRDGEIERDISFRTRDEAYRVFDTMQELLELYGEVKVADLCDLAGVESSFTDNRYGWKSLRTAAVIKRGNGWVIDLPRVRVLD